MSVQNPAILVDNVSFSFGKLKALDKLSLTIEKGISFGLLGPNGAGKTTLIRALTGLLTVKRGSIYILGDSIAQRNLLTIGYMPQQASLYNELTIYQNVHFFASLYHIAGDERRELVEEAIRLVELWDRRDDAISRLSGGMKQRVSLACAIVHKPAVLFLDEPTVGLDPELRVNFWDHFKSLNQQGITIVVSSHTMDDAAHCDRLAFIRYGRVIAQGTPAELRKATGRTDSSLEDAFLYFVRQGDESHAH
jgi:ABC-2 type transport system ATP-binding protein